MTYSPTNLCSTSGPLSMRGTNGIYTKKRTSALTEILLLDNANLIPLSRYATAPLRQVQILRCAQDDTKKKRTSIAWSSLRKSGDDLLSHKRNAVEFVGAGSNRSHAAWTEFMPVRVAERRHHQERRLTMWKVKGENGNLYKHLKPSEFYVDPRVSMLK